MTKKKKGSSSPDFSFDLSWQDKATFELKITIGQKKVAQAYQEALRALSKDISLPGFRKGKAPLAKAEEKLGKEAIYREVINLLLPQAYQQGLKKHDLQPITEPKIVMEKAKEGEDWQIKVVGCIMPQVDLGPYKEEIKKINAQGKIWTPDKGGKEPSQEEKELERQRQFEEILKTLLEKVKITIPQLIIEAEEQKKLVALVDQLNKTGLTIDQYLNSKGKTIDQLKEEMRKEIESNWRLELILEKIADEEKIQVEKEELEKTLSLGEKDKKKKQQVNPYLLARFLRRQKTVDYLLRL